ncbi:Rsp5p-dependent ubiquitination, sorting of cargo proteins at the multivesicular body [Phlyctochytrium planicorne]|nr:Rsp5p-dependent ubiquitination, sorting of cargo proteins at the multivesicular body [Phlyctochytrium planicorne]
MFSALLSVLPLLLGVLDSTLALPIPIPVPKGGGGRPGGGGGRTTTTTTTTSSSSSSRGGGVYYAGGGYSSRSVSSGGIAGIVVGCIVFVLIIVIIIIVCNNQSRRTVVSSSKTAYKPVGIGSGFNKSSLTTTTTTTQSTTIIYPGEYPKPGSFLASFNNATEAEFEAAAQFQRLYPPSPFPAVQPQDVSEINRLGPQDAWLLEFESGTGVSGQIEKTVNGGGGQHITFTLLGRTVALLSRLPLAIDPYTPGRSWYYFEVTITEMTVIPNPTVLSVGLATKPYPPYRHIGWNKNSVGYHSDDGRAFHNDGFGGRLFASSFTKNDTIGCGYDPNRGAVFYTLNGTHLGDGSLGPAFHDFRIAVAADGPCSIFVNVGGRPFMYPNANVGCTRPDRLYQSQSAYGPPPSYPN